MPHPTLFRCLVLLAPLALVAGLLYGQEQKQITPNSIRVEPLQGDEGYWITLPDYREIGSPAISPDSEWVAFDAYKDGYNHSPAEIWIARSDGSELTNLTNGATPRWSPDSEQLVFMRRKPDEPQSENDILMIRRDGSDEKKVTDGRWPDWSSDGTKIVFSRGGKRSPWGGINQFSRVYTANVDGSDEELIADGDGPAWSPTGRHIACSQYDPLFRAPIVRIINLQTGNHHLAGYGWFRPNWMSDGSAVAVNGFTERGRRSLIRLPIDPTDEPTPILTEFVRPLSPSYSKDGKYIVFIAEQPPADEVTPCKPYEASK